MSKKGLLIWAILLIVPGAVGLWSVITNQASQQAQIRVWQSQIQDKTDQYLQSYQQWNALKPEQKNDTPWGHGIFGGSEIQRQLEQNQDKQLAIDMVHLANGSKTVPEELAEVMYGPGWQDKVDQFRQNRETREMIIVASSVSLGSGVFILTLVTLIWMVKTIFLRKKQKQEEQITDEKPVLKPQKVAEPLVKTQPAPTADTPEPDKEHSPSPALESDTQSSLRDVGYFESIRSARKTAGLSTCSLGLAAASAQEDAFSSEPQMMTTEPVLNSLSELTEEVSAIRQFAAKQQDQMKKLQDGYDWMLIRRFCLRIIRSIDNISDRIRIARQQDKETQSLEEIRDELSFALESSGVEQFEPDIGADYKGLERYAEAIHEKEPNDQPERSSTIARVLRPGYQYLISDEEVKIVRCAQVKLFE
ncbi:MAG: nucleotide exchange factor GrpE [Sedimentisphaerales bacterium]|nr:nucleotide exchange factor GrpE [Sedimentisphaerales bacterium]